MKFITTSDWHIKDNNPVHRVGDYTGQLLDKVSLIVDLANKHKAILLIAGDIFDKYNQSNECVNKLTAILQGADFPVLSVAGQHDQRNYSLDMMPTAYKSLIDNKSIIDVTNKVVCGVYGLSWGSHEDLTDYSDVEILLVHHTITETPVPFFLEEGISSKDFADLFPDIRYIVSGDYHTTHSYRNDTQLLLNPGSLCRSTKKQIDHKPCCYLLDTDTQDYTKIYIPIVSKDECFHIPVVQEIQEDLPDKLKELTTALGTKQKAPEFKDTVLFLMNTADMSQEHKQLAIKYMEE